MKNLYIFYQSSKIRLARKSVVFILFLICLFVAALNEGKAQTVFTQFVNDGIANRLNLIIDFGGVNVSYTSGTVRFVRFVDGNVMATGTPIANGVGRYRIQMPATVPDGTTITVEWDSGLFAGYSAFSQNFANLTVGSPNGYTPPTITSLSPANGATNVGNDPTLSVTFSAPVSFSASSLTGILINEIGGGSNFYPISSGNSRFSLTNGNQTFNFDATAFAWSPNADYEITIFDGLEDAGGDNAIVSGIWGFSTASSFNSPPTDITLIFGNSFDENQQDVSEGLTALETTDADAGDSHTYSLVAGSGDTDNSDFEIVGNILRSKAPFDFEAQNQYFIRIQTDDGNGGTFSKAFTINVNNIVDETPPVVSSRTPADDSFNVSLSADLVLNFNETVSFENDEGTFELRTVSPDALVESFGFGQVSPSTGSTITINPTSNLLPDTDYYVLIGSDGVFVDQSENAFAGFENPADWNFSTSAPADNTAPSLSANPFNPTDGATDVAVDDNFQITFDEPIQLGGGLANLWLSTGTPVENFNILEVAVSGNTLTIDPTNDLLPLTSYYITINSGFIEDLAGNDFGGFTDNATYNFTTSAPSDNTPPALAADPFNPTDDAMDVPVDATIQITFDEPIATTTATNNQFSLRVSNTAALVPTTKSISGNTLILTPNADLANSTAYYVTIGSGAIQDLNGNANTAPYINDATTYNFTTVAAVDNTPPEISSLSPVNNAVNVALDEVLTLTFDEDVQYNRIGNGLGRIRKVSDGSFFFSFGTSTSGVTLAGNTLTIDAPTDFEPNTEYYVEITNPSFNFIEDLNGNEFPGFSGTSTWSFTTVDNIAPTATLSPSDDATDVNVDANFTLTFNEVVQFVDAASISDALFLRIGTSVVQGFSASELNLSGNVLTINPSSDLQNGQNYNIRIFNNLIEDLAGNRYAGFSDQTSWNFTTEKSDQTITFDPIPNKLSNDPNFSLDATASSGLAVSYTSSNTSVATVSGNTVTINGIGTTNITASQAGNSTYNAAPDVVRSLEVTAADITAPAAVLSPLDDAVDVALDTDFTVTFDEDVQFINPASSSDALFLRIGTSVVQGFSASELNLSGRTLTIDPTNDLQPGTTYNLRIFNNLIEDLAGNAYAGFSDQTSWNFTTEKADQIISFSPLANRTFGGSNFSLNATASSGLSVTYASTNTGVATVSGNTVTIVGAGTTTITASQSGNTVFNAAPDVQQTLTVNKASQTISFTTPSTRTYGGANFSLNATATSGLPVSFSSSDSDIIDVSGNTGDIIGAGDVDIIASQAGNANYEPAINVVRMVTVEKAVLNAFADSKTRAFGEANPTFTISYSNFITGDDINDIDIEPTASTLATSASDVGDYAIELSGGSDDNYTFNFIDGNLRIFQASQTITFDPIPNKTFGDTPFTVNATASSGLVVEFDIINGPATISGDEVTITGAGNVIIGAQQDGNLNYNAAAATNQSFTVAKADQTIDITPIPDKLITDAPFAVSATASSGLAVSFSVSSGPATMVGNTVTLNGVSGTVVLNVFQTGNVNYNSIFTTTSFVVSDPALLDQTITFDAIPDKVFGDSPFNLAASASSGLDVTFSIVSGPVSLDDDEVTITGAGTVEIAANQAGDGTYNPAPEVTRSFTISKADQTITFDAIPDKTFGDVPFDLSATASSGLDVTFSVVSGPVTLDDDELTITGTGTVEIAANQAGNTTYNPAPEVTRSFTIVKADQTITIDPIADKVVTDASFDVIATTTSGLTLNYDVSGPATISGNTINLDGTQGTVTVTVEQVGNGNYNSASATETFEVTDPSKQDQTITFDAVADKTFGDTPFTLSASASSGLAVAFSVVSGPISLIGDEVTITGAGTAVLAANQAGDSDFNAALEVTQSFVISKADQTITIDPIADKLTTDAPFDVVATTTSGLNLTYTISGPSTISGTTITLNGTAGTVTVTVEQPGDDNYNGSAATESFEVTEEQVLSISDELEFEIYPNPTTSRIYLSNDPESKILNWSISDLNGAIIKEGQGIGESGIDLEEVNEGVYFLRLETHEGRQDVRFIKR